MDEAREIIGRLGLTPLEPEGGWYRETYRGAPTSSGRCTSTAIYYLLCDTEVSRVHRLPNDEVWHFYLGDPVELLILGSPPAGSLYVLGRDLASGQRPQVLVPAGAWQSARLSAGGRFALMGTTVAPGYEATDFDPGEPRALSACYPQYAGWFR